jgi:hypothetical protein
MSRRLAVIEADASFLSHAGPVGRTIRSIRRGIAIGFRRRVIYSPIPVLDVRADGEGFESTGSEPHFELRPHGGRFPTGWVCLKFELRVGMLFTNSPFIYADSGEGYTEASRIFLPYPQDGIVHAIVKLPSLVYGIRLDPLDRIGTFRLGKLSMQEISNVEAGIRLVAPLAREVFSDPRRMRLALGTAWTTWRKGGLRGLKERFRDRTRSR